MHIVAAILVVAIAAITAIAIVWLFVWGAMKDGDANAVTQARIRRGRRRDV